MFRQRTTRERTLWAIPFILLGSAFLSGCPDGDAEDALDDAGDAVEDAVDDTGDAIEDATDG